MSLIKKVNAFIFTLILIFTGNIYAQTIQMKPLTSEPVLDGSGLEWNAVSATTITLHSAVPGKQPDVDSVIVKGGVFGDSVYFFAQWKDDTKDDTSHKPYVWSSEKKTYITAPEREDRFAMQFEMEGNYSANWFSGNLFKADMWHWKAYRSNTIGLAHDKMTIISDIQTKKAFKATAMNRKQIFISRPGDKGDKLYKSMKYQEKKQDFMQKYILNPEARGSVTDVKAKAAWENGVWSLELKRKLSTGHADDVIFAPGKSVKAGIAVFNRVSGSNHDTSDTLVFRF